jgi:hypothetical protein
MTNVMNRGNRIMNIGKKQGVEVSTFRPDEKPFGLTYGQWTAKWWQWALSIPSTNNPISDETGEHASTNQNGPVWFLAGTFGENKIPNRRCEIPYGKAVLFPVINYEANYLQDPQLNCNSELIRHVTEDINDITTLIARFDGNNVGICRVQSDPSTFPLIIHTENSLGVSGGHTIAAADGYWVFLRPMPTGKHDIYFHGACSGGIRNSSAKYEIIVN